MTDLLAARTQMAVSLGFHIIFACIGMAMPFFMAVAHWKWLRTRNKIYLHLTQSWMRGVAILFAIGAVSGTVLAFELGLLFPEFMKHAGPIIGLPFAWEGTAFFLEAIALGLFLYGWNRIKQWVHWASGLMVGICGVASGLFVVCANGWMNHPTGFDWVNGEAINIDPIKAMFNSAALNEGIHMTLAAFVATGFAVAGIHAFLMLKDRNNVFHAAALKIALTFGATAALLQPLSGHFSAAEIASRQPEKFAAMESLFETTRGAPLLIGGIPSEKDKTVRFAIQIPKGLSFLAHGDFNAEVLGLDAFPPDETPPVLVTHMAFQVMTGIGFYLAALSLLCLFLIIKKNPLLLHSVLLRVLAGSVPLGFIAIEAGWIVTEVGRQPWIIYRVMKVSEAVSPMPGLIIPLILITLLYVFLAFVAAWLLRRQIKAIKGYQP